MEIYLWVFVNFEQDNWAQFLLMAKFAYNNTKIASTSHTLLEFNRGYHPASCLKKISTPNLDQCLRVNDHQSFENSWLSIAKISSVLKNLRNKLMIWALNLEATLLMTKFS